MGLFSKKKSDWDKVRDREKKLFKKIENTSNQKKLAKFVYDVNHNVKKKALEKITDQSILGHFALYDKSDFSMREKVVDRLTNKNTLQKIAQKDDNTFVRKAALNRLIELGDLKNDDIQVFVDALGHSKSLFKNDVARLLLGLAKSQSQLLLNYWSDIQLKINSDPHGDHYDKSSGHHDSIRSSDCCPHTDNSTHTDSGVFKVEFPSNPPKL